MTGKIEAALPRCNQAVALVSVCGFAETPRARTRRRIQENSPRARSRVAGYSITSTRQSKRVWPAVITRRRSIRATGGSEAPIRADR